MEINHYITDLEKVTYAKEETRPFTGLDCSLGINPYGISPFVANAFSEMLLHPQEISDYPHGRALTEAISRYWANYAAVDPDQISLCNGSIDGIYQINRLFYGQDVTVLGMQPQFSDYVMDAAAAGFAYRAVPLSQGSAYRFPTERFLSAICPDISLIYLDNPNNPTGQLIARSDVAKILEKAAQYGIYVILDEAYGDYVSPKESAVSFLSRYDRLIVLRSFSKGFGMAGIRAGYILAGKHVHDCLERVINPYIIGQPFRRLAISALEGTAFLEECCQKISLSKKEVRNSLHPPLHMAANCESCPICLLWHEDQELDLAQAFMDENIKVCSGAGFTGLDKNSARLRIPAERDMPQLLHAISVIAK